jgi:alpha-D-ribose 1-methylphosphonate 5-triphosphate diphosphatase PhnM
MLRIHDTIAIRNIRAVLPDGILENGSVIISDGQISRRLLHELVKLFTRNPSRAVSGSTDTGEIVPGLQADLILLNNNTNLPRVTDTFVGGRPVYLGGGLKYS